MAITNKSTSLGNCRNFFKAKNLSYASTTYLLICVFSALNADDLSGCLEFAISRLHKLALEGGVVLNVSGLVDTALDAAGSRLVGDLAVGLPIDIL